MKIVQLVQTKMKKWVMYRVFIVQCTSEVYSGPPPTIS